MVAAAALEPGMPLLQAEDLLGRDGGQELPEVDPILEAEESALGRSREQDPEGAERRVLGILHGLVGRRLKPPPGQSGPPARNSAARAPRPPGDVPPSAPRSRR